MTDEQHPLEYDARLAARLRSYAETGVRPFEAGRIAASAIAAGHTRRAGWTWRLRGALRQSRQAALLVALGLLLVAAVVALVGSGLRPEPGPIAGAIAVWGGGQEGDEIRIVDPDGSGLRILPMTDAHNAHPVWSPDGTRIAYTGHEGRQPVYVINADGTGARSITEGYASALPAAWSPDGRQLAFVGYRYPGAARPGLGLYVVNADGTGLMSLGGPDGELSRLSWAPDGSLIAVVAIAPGTVDRPGQAFLHVVDPRTAAVVRVSASPLELEADFAAPSWRPDSGALVYAVARSRDAANGGIAVAERSPAGWTERIVVSGTGGDLSPQWLNSDRFVFVRNVTRLMVANGDGSGQRQLVRTNLMAMTVPCVAPDGSRVAAALAQEDGATTGELLVVPIDADLAPRRIPTGDIWGQGPTCSWQALKP